MPPRRQRPDPEKRDQILADIRRDQTLREKTYREQALNLFPHVCGRCGREFSGKNLRELTVHHKDNDHLNNPPDGSNWELLCLYCHDNEHETPYERDASDSSGSLGIGNRPTLGFKAFEGLKDLLPKVEPDSTPPEDSSVVPFPGEDNQEK